MPSNIFLIDCLPQSPQEEVDARRRLVEVLAVSAKSTRATVPSSVSSWEYFKKGASFTDSAKSRPRTRKRSAPGVCMVIEKSEPFAMI